MSNKMPFFKNIHDSGIIKTWFSLITNALITSAAVIIGVKGSNIAMAIAGISYIFLAAQATHGTREQYEFLKQIYVHPNKNRIVSVVMYLVLFSIRALIMFLPISIFWWSYFEGTVPF